ncbi:hypothetical protein BIW11_09804 [Tropilaelaps mercedesae]|uniref:Small integral membrane protein 12-like n=1 Tax=Tropilaelaps mercedesae TaxID=418985 RepID=A0A1V9XIR0_9ACAR|nr:hypothetical protein BIW11_09804 [Tropilaelaps mercedesae]
MRQVYLPLWAGRIQSRRLQRQLFLIELPVFRQLSRSNAYHRPKTDEKREIERSFRLHFLGNGSLIPASRRLVLLARFAQTEGGGMWPLWIAFRTYAPYITFPIALVAGVIGYNLEGWMSNRGIPPANKSVQEQRTERHLQNDEKAQQSNKHKTIFDKESNISPSLKS